MKFCPICGMRLKLKYVGPNLPIWWVCVKCGYRYNEEESIPSDKIPNKFGIDGIDIDKLKEIIEYEKKYAIKEILRSKDRVLAYVLDVHQNIGTFLCKSANYFEAGDVIGYIREGKYEIEFVGTVMDSTPYTLTVFLNSYINEGQFIELCDFELLIGYDLQLKLIDNIKNGKLDYHKQQIVNLVINNSNLPRLSRLYLVDKRDVKATFILDDSQIEAVESILSLNNGELILIIGPPGTGKTRVIAKAAYELMRKGEKILITSHTNRAVDNAIEDLPIEKTVRVGRPEKILPHLRMYILSYKARQNLGERLEYLEKQIDKYLKALRVWKDYYKGASGFDKEWYRKSIVRWKEELSTLYKERNEMLKSESERLVREVPIIGSTLIKSHLYPLTRKTSMLDNLSFKDLPFEILDGDIEFDTVFIDECSQASITLALLGMIKGKKIVLVGDHKQLLPIFKTIRDKSIIERFSAFIYLLKKYEHRALWLRWHYRSNNKIIGFSAKYVYDDRIKPVEICKSKTLNIKATYGMEYLDPKKPVVFLHVDGKEEQINRSKCNMREVEACERVVRALINCGIKSDDIGVITPYKAQRKHIKERLAMDGLEVNTVDAFQGREKDVIIFSITSTKNMSFTSDPNRLNVAFTRARYKLIVIGNKQSCYGADDTLLKRFLEYAYEERAIYDVS